MEEIVSKLKKYRQSNSILLKESMKLYEADEEDEEEERVIKPIENDEENHDDSMPPIQGDPDDYEDYGDEEYDVPEDSSDEDYTMDDADFDDDMDSMPDFAGGAPSHGGEPPVGEEGMEGEETEPAPEPEVMDTDQYINPLDNDYAVNYTLGDEVVLSYANGTNSELKGHIEGYDTEGFYRVKWDSGLTTNGITDIALADLVGSKKESVCVCGGTRFLNEGKYVVCDDCGRRIREMKMDHLTQLDKERPKGKKMIRSTPHPMTTADKPNIDIAESIRKAMKKK